MTSFRQRRHPRDAILRSIYQTLADRESWPDGNLPWPLLVSASSTGGGAGKQHKGKDARYAVFCHQRVNEFHRICHYGIAQKYEAGPTLPRTPLACIDPRIIGNHLAMLAIRRCRNRTGTPEYVCHAVPRSNHVRKQRSSSRLAAVI